MSPPQGRGERSPSSLLSVRLEPVDGSTGTMQRVPGGAYSIATPDLPPGLEAMLDEFLIDRFEVTNAEFREFVLEGGYAEPRFWEHDFVADGVTISGEDAMARLVDRTGLPGPRGWSAQEYPEGTADHPVTGVTWYEAAAYAVFRGKHLPTVFQWEKAARNGRTASGESIILPWGSSIAGWDQTLANFASTGTTSVDAHPFGVSPYGAHGMAGNAAEWLFNRAGEGRAATGGSWTGPMYLFSEVSGIDPFYSSESLGFRLVALESGRQRLSVDQGGAQIGGDPVVPQYPTVDRVTMASYKSHFEYDPVPPDPILHDSIDDGRWIHETVSFANPLGGRLRAHLYVPKSTPPPYQTLLYVPSGASFGGNQSVTESAEWVMGPVVQAGRAVLAIEMTGTVNNRRGADWTPAETGSVRFRNEFVEHVIELGAGIDYLESRGDIDMDRFGYAAFSFGVGSRGGVPVCG